MREVTVSIPIRVKVKFDDDYCSDLCAGKGDDVDKEDLCYYFSEKLEFVQLSENTIRWKRCSACIEETEKKETRGATVSAEALNALVDPGLPKCDTCVHYFSVVITNKSECHLNPPAVFFRYESGTFFSKFPDINHDSWCGQHKEKRK